MPKTDDLPPSYKLLLGRIPYGRNNAIPVAKLAKAINKQVRTVSSMVHDLRLNGYLIGSAKGSNSGYYKITNLEESQQTLNMLKHQRDDASRVITALEKSVLEQGGQFHEYPTTISRDAEQTSLKL